MSTTVAAAALKSLAAFGLAVILLVEHRHAIRASAFLGLYLALSIFIDAIESRSCFKRDMIYFGELSAVSAAVRLGILVIDEVPKVNLIIDPIIRNASGAEATSGFWSRSLFFFMGPMFRTGFRGALRMRDLGAIGREFSAQRLAAALRGHWRPDDEPGPYALMLACCSTWKSALFSILLPRLLITGFNLAQPYLLAAVLRAADPTNDVDESNTRLRPYIVVATFLAFLGSGLSKSAAAHMKNRLATRVRGGLVSETIAKTHRLQRSTATKNAAVSVISADIGGIEDGLPSFVEIPFVFLESGLGMYLLSRFIQQSSFIIVFPLLFATISSLLLGQATGNALQKWNQFIEFRVSKTSRIISQISAIKTLGLGPKVAEYVQYLRVAEMEISKRYRRFLAAAMSSSSLCDLMTPAVVVAAGVFWQGFGNELRPDVIYPTLALVTHVAKPLSQLLKVVPIAKTMVTCFDRVQKFLCQPEHKDTRLRRPRQADRPPSLSGSRTQRNESCVVSFNNATIAPSGYNKAVLKNVNLDLPRGSISAVFGPTGSGKSTFINALLGEADIMDGSLTVEDVDVAFSGQGVWIPNGSIQDCIVGFHEYDDERFNTVVARCQLARDLEQLPGGQDYMVGPGGIALSGGQRVRVSVARAAYAQEDLVIMDDPLSALDGDTARAIIQGLCGQNGILKRSGATVVISSNMVECLDVADNCIILDNQGKVSMSSPTLDPSLRYRYKWLFGQHNPAISGHAVQEVSESPSQSATFSVEQSNEAESNLRHQGDMKLYSFWLGYLGRWSFLRWFCFIALTGITDSGPKVFLKYWLETAPRDKLYFIGYALLPLVSVAFGVVSMFDLFCRLAPRAAVGVHGTLTKTTFGSTLGFLSSTNSGSIMNMFSLDMTLLGKSVPNGTHNTVYYTLGTLTQLVIVLAGATYMAALVPVILLVLYFLQRFYLRTSRQLRYLDLEAQAPLVAAIQETSKGLVYIRGFGWQQQNMEHISQLIDESQKPVYLLYCAQVFLELILDLLAALIALVLALLTVYLRHTTSPNSVGIAFLSLIVISRSLNAVITSWTSLETSIGSLARLLAFVSSTAMERENGTAALPPAWPSTGEVKIDIRSAGYGVDASGQQRPPVLHDVSLSIDAGKKVGLTGRTGSGKSSVLLALLGFLEYKGSIKIDGVEVNTIPLNQLRARIITISQDQVLLDGTIRDNLLPFDTVWGAKPKYETVISDEERLEAEQKDEVLKETLERLDIWATLEEKGGLDAVLDKVGYSHGELQLLGIARAVVRRRLTGSRLLLVDEGTSSVDSWRDQVVRDMMGEYFKDCTIIVIAHREETVADADVNVTLSNGRVIRYQPSRQVATVHEGLAEDASA